MFFLTVAEVASVHWQDSHFSTLKVRKTNSKDQHAFDSKDDFSLILLQLWF